MKYSDIKKYGKSVTVNGEAFSELFDEIAYGSWVWGLCSKATARKNTVSEIEKGIWGSEMFLALENVRTLKTLDGLEAID